MMDKYKADTDFLRTMIRMYEDSRILYKNGEYNNCCYLCGYVLECALKYILLKFGKDTDGSAYTVEKIKQIYIHNLAKLIQHLEANISMLEGIPATYRLDYRKKTPYILQGGKGHKPWSPEYRYGEHPMWDKEEYCKHYIQESEYVFKFISKLVV